jgi:uncharacterized protein
MSAEAPATNVLESAVRAFQAGDAAGAAAAMAPDVVWHSPGQRQPAAGTHRGLEDVLAAFGTIASQPGDLELEIVDALSGSQLEAVVYRHRRRRPEAQLDAGICLVARVDDGKLVEVWEHIYDVHEFDDFYGQT